VVAKISRAQGDEKTLAELYFTQAKKPSVSVKPNSEPPTPSITFS
jgi:hypothetical protein